MNENIKIEKVTPKDREQVSKLFRAVIPSTYEAEGVGHLENFIREEIEQKHTFFEEALANKKGTSMMVATYENQIVGCVSITGVNQIIIDHLEESDNLYEIGTLFVDYHYHNRGIGQLLLQAAKDELLRIGEKYYVLDSGYGRAKKIWTHLLGEATITLPNYWGEGVDHKIWKREL